MRPLRGGKHGTRQWRCRIDLAGSDPYIRSAGRADEDADRRALRSTGLIRACRAGAPRATYHYPVLPNLASPRLGLSPVSDSDIGLMSGLNADETVMRNLTGRPATAEETHTEWTERLQERSDLGRGLGYWIGRADDVFVGWWGLGACSWEPSSANLGYRLCPAHWGKGLATEGSRTLLRHAFDEVRLATVWASTARANRASQRVLAKLSMRYVGVRYDQCQFEITAAEWAEAAKP